MKPLLMTLGAALLLSGCATNRIYEWGAYDQGLYTLYKSPESAEALRSGLETGIAAVESRGQKPAPGLYAELGTLYLQSGDREKALYYYNKEHAAWPESRHLMDAITKNLKRRPENTK